MTIKLIETSIDSYYKEGNPQDNGDNFEYECPKCLSTNYLSDNSTNTHTCFHCGAEHNLSTEQNELEA